MITLLMSAAGKRGEKWGAVLWNPHNPHVPLVSEIVVEKIAEKSGDEEGKSRET